MARFLVVVGSRPNYIKAYPLCTEFKKQGINNVLISFQQHYDPSLTSFLEQQLRPEPVVYISVHKENKVKQIQDIIRKFKNFVSLNTNFDAVIVVGDVDTSFACSLAASSIKLPIAHIESGLRSFDIAMPEERNRIAVDSLSSLLFTHSQGASYNLAQEGITENIHFVGNVMIDSLCLLMDDIRKTPPKYHCDIVLTLHRPENVDNPLKLKEIIESINSSFNGSVLFPIHPRTKYALRNTSLKINHNYLNIVDPMDYIDFMSEVLHCGAVITDSGGLQEETSYLGIPCFTLRKSTERPVTITLGTNRLVSIEELGSIKIEGRIKTSIPLWDGYTSERIVDILRRTYELSNL